MSTKWLEALGHMALAVGHLTIGNGDGGEEEGQQRRRRRKVRADAFDGDPGEGPAPDSSCCVKKRVPVVRGGRR